MRQEIDRVISIEHVLAEARAFLNDCHWKLEISDSIVKIPKDAALAVRSRAYIITETPDIGFGDHYQRSS